jgi:hypothetical protein
VLSSKWSYRNEVYQNAEAVRNETKMLDLATVAKEEGLVVFTASINPTAQSQHHSGWSWKSYLDLQWQHANEVADRLFEINDSFVVAALME